MVTRALLAATVAGTIAAATFGLAVQAEDIRLVGLDGAATTVTPAALAAMPHVSLTVTVEGKTTTYKGVPLAVLLAPANPPLGKALRGQELRDIVLVSATDGYAAAFALTEADPMMRKDQIIVADEADGHPLAGKEGPYRLVAESDQRGARSVRMMNAVELRRLEAKP
jgi:hypothetical protein